jgi:hypothetical protein
MVAKLKVVKSESSVSDSDDIESLSMSILLPMAESIDVEYHEATGALLVAAHRYTPELKDDVLVRLCPQDEMADILSKITSGSDEVINEAKVFDVKAEGLIKKLTVLMEKSKAKAATQTEEELEDLSKVHTDQTHQFQHCIRILSGLQLFFSRVASYYNKLNVILLEWVDRSLTEYARVESALGSV